MEEDMRFSRPERTSLIINMTLAETFLLLLFVIWYGHTTIIRQDPIAHLKERLKRVEQENERLAKELRQANNQIADLRSRLEFWRQAWYGVFPSIEPTVPLTPEKIAELRKEACRSHPKCEQNNVLVHASVVGGQISMMLLTESPNFSKWLEDSGRARLPAGVWITDVKKIYAFLTAVRDYYARAKEMGSECRFDYRLTYESKEDYYDGRELFERYFYPMGLSRTRTR
jgi:hypothetical protein